MKKYFGIFGLFFLLFSCDKTIEKPEYLIAKDKMISILYDISLLEAIKSQNINGGISKEKENDYIFKKYQIDSIQLARSNSYYLSDLTEYAKMCETVRIKLNQQKEHIEKEMKKKGLDVPPNISPRLGEEVPSIE